MKNHLVGVFHGISDPKAFGGAIQTAVNLVPNGHCFVGDNLFAVGRNMGFLDDAKLMASFAAHAESIVEQSLLWRYSVICWAAHRAMRIEGDLVECACFKGTGARIVADYIDLNAIEKSFYLYDLFEHDEFIPDFTSSEHGSDLYDQVRARFAEFPGASEPRPEAPEEVELRVREATNVIQGKIPEILSEQAPEKIAYLHLDLNDATAEIAALEFFWDRITPGGSIVLDDFGWAAYSAQHVAETAWFAERGYLALELPTGQGLVIK